MVTKKHVTSLIIKFVETLDKFIGVNSKMLIDQFTAKEIYHAIPS